MHCTHALILAVACSLTGTAAVAQTVSDNQPAPTKSAPKSSAKTPAKAAPRPATPREEAKSEAKGMALATETTEAINDVQLGIAARVLTGKADCEYSQTVDVDRIEGHPGMFKVRFKELNYVMVPEETTTGAIRLMDPKTQVVWLQIPAKSMLLNSRAGQRMVDRCTLAEQRAAVEAVTGAAANAEADKQPAAPAARRN